METKSFDDLKPNPKNPRRMSDHDGNALERSIKEFGDLSPIVRNRRTDQLVAGHQRKKIMGRMSAERRVLLNEQAGQGMYEGHEFMDDVGTVALGYIFIGNKQFAYREVDWPYEREMAANIAANRIQGEFDLELLGEATFDLAQKDPELLDLTGQTPEEIKDLLDGSGALGDSDSKPPAEQKMILRIECADDQQMTDLYNELRERGLTVKLV